MIQALSENLLDCRLCHSDEAALENAAGIHTAMPRFAYRAKVGPEKTIEGELTADNEKAALARIESMGYCPVWVREHEKGRDEPGQRLLLERIGRRDTGIFTRQLAGLLKSGVPILRSLRTVRDQTSNGRMRRTVGLIEDEIRDGKMLSDALSMHPGAFSQLYVNMVRSGESGGVLDVILLRLADAYDKEEELRGKLRSALAYPTLVLIVGAVTVFVMMTFFLPRIADLFRNFHDLPLPTRMLIRASDLCKHYWLWAVVPLVLVLSIFKRFATGSRGRLLVDKMKLGLPLAGEFIMQSEIARFARTLSLLIESGIPVERGLALSAGTVNNSVLRREIEQVRESTVSQGMSVAAGLKNAPFFPEYARNMIAVGEESGRIEESLKDVAQYYEREVDRRVVVATSLIEPILILVVGAIVGFIALAMMLPVFAITRAIS